MATQITVTIPAADEAAARRFADVLTSNIHVRSARTAFPIVRSVDPATGGFVILFDSLLSEGALFSLTLAEASSLGALSFLAWCEVGQPSWA